MWISGFEAGRASRWAYAVGAAIVHAPHRLRICTFLDAISSAEFAMVRDMLGVADSVLSKHLEVLHDAGYLTTTRPTGGGRVRTSGRAHPGGATLLPPGASSARLLTVPDVLRAVAGQLDYHWHAGIWPRIADLSDDEYLWEPVPNCWTLRRTDSDQVACDFEWPPPQPSPFTTIAWRLFHIAVGCFAERATRYFPEHVEQPWTKRIWEGPFDFPMNAAGAVAVLDSAWRAWRSGLEAAGEPGLWRPLGDGEGNIVEMQLGSDDPFIGLVLHVHREVIHHSAEILLLRDLYRTTHSG